VHASLSATYSVSDPAAYLENLLADDQERIVKAVVGQAIVNAFANQTVDEVLTRVAREGDTGGNSSIERTIRDLAQTSIDDIGVGISIDQVALRLVFPPARVREEFVRVNEVDAKASRALQEAEEARRRRLNEVAGSAAQPLLDLIGAYEGAVDSGDEARANGIFATIYKVLDGELAGRDVEINGTTYPEVALAGEASRSISEAKQSRTTLVDMARQKSLTFEAKLAQYRANPNVFLVREWTEALRMVMAQPHVQTFMIAGKSQFQILLNNDPEVARALQAAEQRNLTEQAKREKLKTNPHAF